MRKTWYFKSVVLALSLCVGLGWPGNSGSAADRSVGVKMPTFSVSLNGHVIDNSTRMYPLLVYRDITYFPMTWYDSRLLGLETSWSPQNGLSVTQAGVTGRYEPYESKNRNESNFTANVVDGTVHINGVIIDNQSEQYPLLSFRNVTYFPLTWRFAHDMFKWEYQWDMVKGLRITSNNPQLVDSGLPLGMGSNGIALHRGNYYYVESEGSINRIYRASEKNPKIAKEVYQYDAANAEGADSRVSFHINNDQLWMQYRIGYAHYYMLFNEDGEIQQKYVKYRGILDFRETSYGKLVVNAGVSDEKNGNLYIIGEDGSRRQIGDPLVTAYGQTATKDDVTPTLVIGENVYVLFKQESSSPYVLYRINLATDETIPLIEGADWFAIGKGKLFYTQASDKVLYVAELDGKGNTPISDHPVSWFGVIGNNVFYTSKDDAGKLVLYKEEEGKDTRLDTVASVKVGHEQLLIVPEDTSNNGALILDAEGELLWRVAEPISRTFISDEDWIVQSTRDGRVLLIR